MKLTIIESPFMGKGETAEERERETAINIAYAKAAVRDCLARGEAPYASHLFFTQPGILDDNVPDERRLGIEAGLCWGAKADLTAVYADRGISSGMQQGIARAEREGRPVEFRTLPGWSADDPEARVITCKDQSECTRWPCQVAKTCKR